MRRSRPPTRTRHCGVGAAPGAGIASCVMLGEQLQLAAREDSLTHNHDVNDISSNSWGIDQCEYIEDGRRLSTDCPFECPSVSTDDCPCDACDGDDWASGDLSSDCEDAVVDYCTSYFNDDVTPCLELDHYFVQCGFGQISSHGHDTMSTARRTVEAAWARSLSSRRATRTTIGQDVNYEGYQNSRFTMSVGAVSARPQARVLLVDRRAGLHQRARRRLGELPRHARRAAARERRHR